LQSEQINKIYTEFKKANKTKITSKLELVDLLKKLDLMKHIFTIYNVDAAKTPEQRKIYEAVHDDLAVAEIFGESVFRAMDSNNDGAIDFEELIIGISILTKGAPEDVGKLIFKIRDTDNSGYLNREEIAHVNATSITAFKCGFSIGLKLQRDAIHKLGVKDADFDGICDAVTKYLGGPEVTKATVDLVFQFCDKDNDNKITESEFVSWYSNAEEQRKYNTALTTVLQPFIEKMQTEVQMEIQKLLSRC